MFVLSQQCLRISSFLLTFVYMNFVCFVVLFCFHKMSVFHCRYWHLFLLIYLEVDFNTNKASLKISKSINLSSIPSTLTIIYRISVIHCKYICSLFLSNFCIKFCVGVSGLVFLKYTYSAIVYLRNLRGKTNASYQTDIRSYSSFAKVYPVLGEFCHKLPC